MRKSNYCIWRWRSGSRSNLGSLSPKDTLNWAILQQVVRGGASALVMESMGRARLIHLAQSSPTQHSGIIGDGSF